MNPGIQTRDGGVCCAVIYHLKYSTAKVASKRKNLKSLSLPLRFRQRQFLLYSFAKCTEIFRLYYRSTAQQGTDCLPKEWEKTTEKGVHSVKIIILLSRIKWCLCVISCCFSNQWPPHLYGDLYSGHDEMCAVRCPRVDHTPPYGAHVMREGDLPFIINTRRTDHNRLFLQPE